MRRTLTMSRFRWHWLSFFVLPTAKQQRAVLDVLVAHLLLCLTLVRRAGSWESLPANRGTEGLDFSTGGEALEVANGPVNTYVSETPWSRRGLKVTQDMAYITQRGMNGWRTGIFDKSPTLFCSFPRDPMKRFWSNCIFKYLRVSPFSQIPYVPGMQCGLQPADSFSSYIWIL